MTIRQPQISFFGVLYGNNGVRLDPKKIQVILDMLPPTDMTQLQLFLSMVNFMYNFIPHLSSHMAPLQVLLTKNTIFLWNESANAAHQKLKSLIAEAKERFLKVYDRNLPLTVQADASKLGLGVVLSQMIDTTCHICKSVH